MRNKLLKGLRPTHPGEILREDVLPALGKGKAEIARVLRVSRPTLYAILNEERPITPQMAHRIGKLCGNGPEIWLQMQCNYDLAVAEPELERELEQIPTLEAV